jgi:hypothetical protein
MLDIRCSFSDYHTSTATVHRIRAWSRCDSQSVSQLTQSFASGTAIYACHDVMFSSNLPRRQSAPFFRCSVSQASYYRYIENHGSIYEDIRIVVSGTAARMFGFLSVSLFALQAMVRYHSTSLTATYGRVFGYGFEDGKLVPAMCLSLWNASHPLSHAVGSIVDGWVQDDISRRLALALSNMSSAISVSICYASDTPETINAGRAIFHYRSNNLLSFGVSLPRSHVIGFIQT